MQKFLALLYIAIAIILISLVITQDQALNRRISIVGDNFPTYPMVADTSKRSHGEPYGDSSTIPGTKITQSIVSNKNARYAILATYSGNESSLYLTINSEPDGVKATEAYAFLGNESIGIPSECISHLQPQY